MRSYRHGETITTQGFVTRLREILGKGAIKLEDVLGYRPGSLGVGFAIGLLEDTIKVGDFEFRGYTNLEGGKAKGSSTTVHDDLMASYSSHPVDLATKTRIQQQAAARLNRKGLDQTAKVLPLGPVSGYKPGLGASQFELVRPKKFKIAVVVGPGQKVKLDPKGGLMVFS